MIDRLISKEYRGFFAIIILLHHLCLNISFINNSVIAPMLRSAGYLSVSVFFLLSGYGLYAQYLLNGKDYVSKMPQKRIFPFYIQNVVLIAVYSLFSIVLKDSVSIKSIMVSLLPGGGTVIKNGWYIQIILLCYLIFWSIFILDKIQKKILFAGISISIYFLVCYFLDINQFWYVSVFAWILGMLLKKYENFLTSITKENTLLCILVGCILFCGTFFLGRTGAIQYVSPLFKAASANIFASIVWFMMIKQKHILGKTWLEIAGEYSFEIYVVQGLAFMTFRNNRFYLSNEAVYCALVIVMVFLYAATMKRIFHVIHRKI